MVSGDEKGSYLLILRGELLGGDLLDGRRLYHLLVLVLAHMLVCSIENYRTSSACTGVFGGAIEYPQGLYCSNYSTYDYN